MNLNDRGHDDRPLARVLPFKRPDRAPKESVDWTGTKPCPGCGSEMPALMRLCQRCSNFPATIYGQDEDPEN